MTAVSSGVSMLPSTPPNPIDLFLLFLSGFSSQPVTMNLATVDPEEGVMSRTVLFRGIEDNAFRFATVNMSRKYKNIKANPKVALTFLFISEINGTVVNRQVRINGEARELPRSVYESFWSEEPVSAKIRPYICNCRTSQLWETIQKNYDRLLKDFLDGTDSLNMAPGFTGFAVVPTRIEFYQSTENHIGDRVIYKKLRKGGLNAQEDCDDSSRGQGNQGHCGVVEISDVNKETWSRERICC